MDALEEQASPQITTKSCTGSSVLGQIERYVMVAPILNLVRQARGSLFYLLFDPLSIQKQYFFDLLQKRYFCSRSISFMFCVEFRAVAALLAYSM